MVMQNMFQVRRAVKISFFKIQDGGRPMPLRDTFCVIVLNFVEIGRTVADVSHFSRYSSEM